MGDEELDDLLDGGGEEEAEELGGLEDDELEAKTPDIWDEEE